MSRPHAQPSAGKGIQSSAFRAQQAARAARREAKAISDRLKELRQQEKLVRARACAG